MRWLPGLVQFRGYRRAWLRGDLLAGIAVAAYLIPQVMAYAKIAGLSPVTGLYAAIGPLVLYALVGTSRQLSVGPEATTALMTATALAPFVAGDPARYAMVAAMVAVAVGVLCVLGAFVRLGVLADLLSKPVLVGYLAGIGVLMIVSQLGTATGVPVTGDGMIPETWSWLRNLVQVHWPTVVLTVSVLVLLFLSNRFAPRIPGPLLGMLLAAGVVWLFGLRAHGVRVVGEIPAGLPELGWPSVPVSQLPSLALPAIGIAIVGFSDMVLTARAFATRRGEAVDAEQELRALGAINVVAGLSHGFPVSCSATRTVIGDSLGSRTQLYSLVAVATLVVTLFAGRSVLASFPLAALAAVVVYAAVRLIDVAEFRRLARFRRSEVVVALATTVSVLALGVLYGVVAAVALSILDLLHRMARPHAAVLGYAKGVPGMHDVGDYPRAAGVPGLVVFRYDAPLCFANAENFHRRALDAVRLGTEWFVLNAEANIEIDYTAREALDQLRRELGARGITFALARVKRELAEQLAADGLLDKIGQDRIYLTLPAAVSAYLRAYREVHGKLPRGVTMPIVPPSPLTGDGPGAP